MNGAGNGLQGWNVFGSGWTNPGRRRIALSNDVSIQPLVERDPKVHEMERVVFTKVKTGDVFRVDKGIEAINGFFLAPSDGRGETTRGQRPGRQPGDSTAEELGVPFKVTAERGATRIHRESENVVARIV